ncbi:uncharacterized protein N7477_001407 [Penicillium maclennaniae]|uniref:uncharacterized protein n=1 Tax=Penicillium maclennaniae TaxID=1343394 RepID=UPI00254259DE|nr:uncharacterized protein N7477_001407 [Penicillium maclennaniae]KAJ5681467.1 hypothetical protein N7477_001407 [Penicillium maclennaniae]
MRDTVSSVIARTTFDNDPNAKPPLPQSGRYIELDDFSRPESPVLDATLNENLRAAAGQRRSRVYFPNTLWTRTFFTTVIIETIATVAIESWVFISISDHLSNLGSDDGSLRLRSFLGLYIFALLYELGLSYDALRRKNTFQLVGLCICNLGLFTYGIIQIWEVKKTIKSLATNSTISLDLFDHYHIELMLVPMILGVAAIIMMGVTWKLRAEFSWSIYKNISADLQMNRRYYVYQVYIALLKFDFFFIFGSQLQLLLAMGHIDDDFIINAAMVPIAILALFLAARFARNEKTKSMSIPVIFICGLIASEINTLYKLYTNSTDGLGSYKVSLGLFSSIAILLMACTIINSIMCILNFNKGLKDHIDQLRGTKPAVDVEGDAAMVQSHALY